jgi:hypothetical protein
MDRRRLPYCTAAGWCDWAAVVAAIDSKPKPL